MTNQFPKNIETNKITQPSFVPALSFHWLTPFYDRIVSFTTNEAVFKSLLLSKVDLAEDHTLLDLGCGSGTLAIDASQRNPLSSIHAFDVDKNILKRAYLKSIQAGVKINFIQGSSTTLPYSDSQFDIVVSSLVFHHLSIEDKDRTLEEIYRVLKPGGEFHFADWGRPQSLARKVAFFLLRLFDGLENTRDCLSNRIPDKMKALGLQVSVTAQVPAMLGNITILRARKLASE